MLRPFLAFCFCILSAAAAVPAPEARPATADERALLAGAVRSYTVDVGRWAYTETTVQRDEKGKPKNETVVRFDPSRPYPQQWTVLSVNGAPPSERDRAKFRKRGEQAHRASEIPGTRRRYTLGELIEFEGAKVVEQDAREAVFELPLRKENNTRFPADKFLVLARVNKAQQALVNVSVQLRESFRQKLVVKVKSGEGTLDFEKVDPKFGPTLTTIRGDTSVSVLFVSVGGTFDLQRKEFKRVKPYDERFDVKIGELKALDF